MTTIIAFAGRKQSGKTSCAEFIKNTVNKTSCSDPELMDITRYQKPNHIKIYNFADPLKILCMDILGLEYNQCYGDDANKNELVDCFLDNKQLTAREVLQIVGTEMFRSIQKNVWSNATIRKITKDKPDLALIADCRFPNEVDVIKNNGGIVIKLTRNLYNSNHASEIALDPEYYDQSIFDLVIDNKNLNITQQNSILLNFLIEKRILPL